MRIAITGTGGYVGGALARALGREGHELIALSRATGIDWQALDRAELVVRLRGAAALIHCAARVHVRGAAAQDQAAFDAANVEVSRLLAQAAAEAGVGRFILLSSIAVHGLSASGALIDASTPVAPRDAYGRSKWRAEQAVAGIARATGLAVVILRPPLIYGPGAPGNMARLAQAIARGWPLPLAAARTNRRSLCAIDTLIEVIRWALADPRAVAPASSQAAHPAVWYPADPLAIATRRLIEALARGLGRRPRLLALPAGVLRTLARVSGQRRLFDQLLGDLEIDPRPLERAGCRLATDTEAALEAMGKALRAAYGR
ncbi:MAG: NAD-dependent epimerase/dehydratase family protein [Casimicrobiaceae bacterium]